MIAQKFRIYPTKEQEAKLVQYANATIKVWNWALARWEQQYEDFKEGRRQTRPNASSLSKEFTGVWRTEIPWLTEINAQSYREAFRSLDKAWKNFFRGLKSGRRCGSPRFKSVRDSGKSFYVHNQMLKEDEGRIFIPKVGWLRLRQERRFPGKIVGGRVTFDGVRWHISLQFDHTPKLQSQGGTVGIDRGGVNAIATSGGQFVTVPVDKKLEQRIRRQQRRLSRMKKGSNNRAKQKLKIARMLRKVKDRRNNIIHAATTELCRQNSTIFIEKLATQKMTRKGNKARNKSVLNSAPYEIERQLSYKADWRDSNVLPVNPAYTSQRCSECGFTHPENRKTQSEFSCLECGHKENADTNAAKNILWVGISGEDLSQSVAEESLMT